MITEIHDEYTGKTYPIKSKCQTCFRYQDVRDSHWIYNIASGRLHLPEYYTNEVTHCGKPCTEKNWLHQL